MPAPDPKMLLSHGGCRHEHLRPTRDEFDDRVNWFCADCEADLGYETDELTERQRVVSLIGQIKDLRSHVERWAADSGMEPWAHGQEHNIQGTSTGICAMCEMNWPCPSALLMEWRNPSA